MSLMMSQAVSNVYSQTGYFNCHCFETDHIDPITVSLLGAESAPLMYLLLQLIQKLMASARDHVT